MMITEEMIAEDEKRWHARNIVVELGYCGKNICNRKYITNDDIRFYAYIMRKAHTMLKEQEPMQVKTDMYGNAYCPWCSTEKTIEMGVQKLHLGTRFCPYCGKAVMFGD